MQQKKPRRTQGFRQCASHLKGQRSGCHEHCQPHLETAIFRIIQEAITNIVRHAGAESASISIEFEDASIAVNIEDDGNGFDLDEAMKATRGGRGPGFGRSPKHQVAVRQGT